MKIKTLLIGAAMVFIPALFTGCIEVDDSIYDDSSSEIIEETTSEDSYAEEPTETEYYEEPVETDITEVTSEITTTTVTTTAVTTDITTDMTTTNVSTSSTTTSVSYLIDDAFATNTTAETTDVAETTKTDITGTDVTTTDVTTIDTTDVSTTDTDETETTVTTTEITTVETTAIETTVTSNTTTETTEHVHNWEPVYETKTVYEEHMFPSVTNVPHFDLTLMYEDWLAEGNEGKFEYWRVWVYEPWLQENYGYDKDSGARNEWVPVETQVLVGYKCTECGAFETASQTTQQKEGVQLTLDIFYPANWVDGEFIGNHP